MTATPDLAPDVQILVAALHSYRGAIAARRTRAATESVDAELTTLVSTEDELIARLTDVAELTPSTFTESRSVPSPGAVVAALATGLLPTREALLTDASTARAISDRADVAAAGSQDRNQLADVLDDIAAFYRAWADWQVSVAKEITVGAVARLRPTPLQRTVAGAKAVATLPLRAGREFGERAASGVREARTGARDQAMTAAGQIVELFSDVAIAAADSVDRSREAVVEQAFKAVRVTDAAWSAGREAALRDGEREARRTGSHATAGVLHETRAALGVLDADELPVRGYDSLRVHEAADAVSALDDPADLTVLEAYEREHKNRKTVHNAIVNRSSDLAARV